jgi:ubiquinone/menaquinone biosynthesis C-methylase UbiE
VKKADYSKIASFFDQGRTLSEYNMDLWLNIIARLSGGTRGSRVLDLGCGTGRFSIPMAVKLGYRVTGADYYEEMLDKAREKDSGGLVMWDKQDAQDLSYPDKSFDIVFMSFLLHHCDDQYKVICECLRVLDDPGVILIRHAGFEQIKNDVEHIFFPETLAVDKARIHSVKKVERFLKDAGFSRIISEEIIQRTFTDGAARLKAISVKNTSSLTIIPQDAFKRGLRKLESYIDQHPDDPWLQYDAMRMTAGFRTK